VEIERIEHRLRRYSAKPHPPSAPSRPLVR
jgi:hypothetical protein